jgi:hypothetical protein
MQHRTLLTLCSLRTFDGPNWSKVPSAEVCPPRLTQHCNDCEAQIACHPFSHHCSALRGMFLLPSQGPASNLHVTAPSDAVTLVGLGETPEGETVCLLR